ncbi:hypothetical protein GF352_01730|nr:hypothetical protein [archaeon]
MAFLKTNYIKKDSVIHSLNPLVKFSWVSLVVVLFLFSGSMTLFIVVNIIILLLAFLGKVGRDFIKGLVFMIGPIFLFSLMIHGLFNPFGISEEVLFSFYTINISLEGFYYGLFFGFKISALISVFYLFILTTYPGRMVTSLRTIGFPHKLGFLVNATLQIVPLMLREAETIIDAQRARGLETKGSITKRLGAYVPLLGPIVLGSVMKVYERTIALEVRGFSSTADKTSLYVENITLTDKLLIALSVVLLIIYVVFRVIG